jgi:predicted metal-dependent hydrolase
MEIAYAIRRTARSRRLSVRVDDDGRVTVVAPPRASEALIRRFVDEQAPWIAGAVAKAKAQPQRIRLAATGAERTRLMAATRKFVGERLHFWNQQYRLRPGVVRVRDQKTRWGSCARNGDLSFNYRLALLPTELADYVVVHELCHVAQFDHSPKFWTLVAQAVPRWKVLRRQLNAEWKIGK